MEGGDRSLHEIRIGAMADHVPKTIPKVPAQLHCCGWSFVEVKLKSGRHVQRKAIETEGTEGTGARRNEKSNRRAAIMRGSNADRLSGGFPDAHRNQIHARGKPHELGNESTGQPGIDLDHCRPEI